MDTRVRVVALAALAAVLACSPAATAPQAAPDELPAAARQAYEIEGPAAALPLLRWWSR